jgi:hypothetical protein
MDWNSILFLAQFQFKETDERLSYAQNKTLINEGISEGPLGPRQSDPKGRYETSKMSWQSP